MTPEQKALDPGPHNVTPDQINGKTDQDMNDDLGQAPVVMIDQGVEEAVKEMIDSVLHDSLLS